MGNTGRFEWRNILGIFVDHPCSEVLHSVSGPSRFILQEPRECSGILVNPRILVWPQWEGTLKLLCRFYPRATYTTMSIYNVNSTAEGIFRLQWDFH